MTKKVIIGWITLFKGVEEIGFPDRVNKKAQMFKGKRTLWGAMVFFIGVFYFWISLEI